MAFAIRRGTNISHWLSQSRRRGAERRAWFTERDVQRIAEYGFDHIRIPIDEEQMWDAEGGQEEEAFDLLDSAVDWCERAGLRVVVDLHILRSHYFNDRSGGNSLFTDPEEMERFGRLWVQLSERLRDRPVEQVAYELLNEAVAEDPADWNRVAHHAFDTVRKLEGGRTIVLGSNWYNTTDTYDQLEVPDDEGVLLTFHFYKPMLLTHYTAGWWPGGAYAGPVHYPGLQVLPEELEGLEGEMRALVERENRQYDRAAMEADLAKPLAVSRRTGRPLHCGEFGCFEKAPQELRLAWYRDLIAVFDAFEIAWSNWDYKGSFGIVTAAGEDTGIAAALLGRG